MEKMDNDLNTLKTDIALIQKDVKQIERVFKRLDTAVDQMSDVNKSLAVQGNVLENNSKRIENTENKFAKHVDTELEFRKELSLKIEDMKNEIQVERDKRHKELLESIDKLNRSIAEKQDDQDKRLSALENWRWYMLGIGVVVLFILNKIPWAIIFG